MAVTARRIVHGLPRMAVLQAEAVTEKKLVQVAAYARVSTEKDEQEDSFERQVEHYTSMIENNSEWHLVRIYADPGISGTRAEKRPEFMQMIADCREGKIEKVLVKSISRFARNTVDALNYIRELKDLGISVYFESENIDTLTPGGEVLLTILAAMAEQESRTISTNIKWAWQRKFQNGDIILNTGLMLGYRKTGKTDEDGHVIYEIEENEAEIVRRIYREFLAGITVTRICRGLEEDGIKTKLGKSKWRAGGIESILTNEKYTGNAVLGKTYKPDVLTRYRKANDGEKAPMYYVENSHPAIIEPEMFELVKAEIAKRKQAGEKAVGSSRYTSKYPFSGLMVCSECGSLLRRHVRTMGAGNKVASWACKLRVAEGRANCDSHHVREDVLIQTYLAAIKQMSTQAEEVIAVVREGTLMAMEPKNVNKLKEIENDIIALQEQVLKLHKDKMQGLITDTAYNKEIKRCSEKMTYLEQQQEELRTAETRYTEVKRWLDNFEKSLVKGDINCTLDAGTMKGLIERINVSDTGIEVIFKCGAKVSQEYIK